MPSKTDRFINHLQEFGLLAPGDSDRLKVRCSSQDEKLLIFELSSFFQAMNASDYYDLSSRLYTTWCSLENLQENSAVKSQKNDKSTIFHQQPTDSLKYQITSSHQYIYSMQSGKHDNETIHPDHSEQDLDDLAKFNFQFLQAGLEKLNKLIIRHEFLKFKASLQQNYTQRNQTLLNSNSNSKLPAGNSGQKSQVTKSSIKDQPRKRLLVNEPRPEDGAQDSPTRNQDIFTRLHEEKILKEQNRLLRQELYELMNLKEYNFSPKINPQTERKQESDKSAQHSVFDRLATKKIPKATLIHQSRELKEMEEATFHPNISRSQRIGNHPEESGVVGKERVYAATERLYQDAELKQKVLRMKRDYLKEQELKDCTFTPQLMSAKTARERSSDRLKSPVDRLYNDSIKRKQLQLHKEAIKEEFEAKQYTFKPNLYTKNYRGPEPKNSGQPRDKYSEIDFELSNDSSQLGYSSSRGRSAERNPIDRVHQIAKKKQEPAKNSIPRKFLMGNERSQRSQSVQEARNDRSQSARAKIFLNDPIPSADQGSMPVSPVFNRLYETSAKKKQKLAELENQLAIEQGLTFHPKKFTTKGTEGQDNWLIDKGYRGNQGRGVDSRKNESSVDSNTGKDSTRHYSFGQHRENQKRH